jgi:hypothetical protein
MVGVRYRRALFPGYSDSVEYLIDCPTTIAPADDRAILYRAGDQEVKEFEGPTAGAPGSYQVVAKLMYRKVDQFLINFLLGEDSGLTAPVVEMTRAEATIQVSEDVQEARTTTGNEPLAAPAGG